MKWIGLVALFLSAQPLAAAVVLDQSNLVDTSSGPVVASSLFTTAPSSRAVVGQSQTVTAGIAGVLARIDLQLFRVAESGLMSVLVFSGDHGGGSGSLVGRYDFDVAELPSREEAQGGALFTVDTSGFGMVVAPGDVFSIVPYIPYKTATELVAAVIWGYEAGLDEFGGPLIQTPAYAGGYNTLLYANGTDQETGADRGFRTYVDIGTSAVPEPSTWLVLIVGFATLGSVVRWQRRVRQKPKPCESVALR